MPLKLCIFHERILHHVAENDAVAEFQRLFERVFADDVAGHARLAAEEVAVRHFPRLFALNNGGV